MSAELALEYMALALETTRGTAIADPTDYFNGTGQVTWTVERHHPEMMRGTLIQNYQSIRVQEGAEWECEGTVDTDTMPLILNAAVAAVSSPSTPGGATNTRLWTFSRSATADNIKSLSVFWGDPNVQVFRSAYGMVDELSITVENGGSVMWSASGQAKFPVYKGDITNATAANPVVITSVAHGLVDGDNVTIAGVVGMTEINDTSFTVANATANTFELSGEDGTGHTAYTSGGTWTFDAPTAPALTNSPLLIAQNTDVWLDTSSNIGTTQLSGRVVEAELTIPTGVSYKRTATGAGGGIDFQAIGRGVTAATCSITFELEDLDQLDVFRADTAAKLRLRANGAVIETVSGTTFYNYLQWDIYGPMDFSDWGDLEGTNRTVTFEIVSEYDSTAATDYKVYVQNDNTSL